MVDYLAISPKITLSDALSRFRMHSNEDNKCSGEVSVELQDFRIQQP